MTDFIKDCTFRTLRNVYLSEFRRVEEEDIKKSLEQMKDDIYGTVIECCNITLEDLRGRFKKASIQRRVRRVPQRLKEVGILITYV